MYWLLRNEMTPKPAFNEYAWIAGGRNPWKLSYSAWSQWGLSWFDAVYDGATGGTTGQGRNLEAIQVRLSDEYRTQYPTLKVCYAVWVHNVGASTACDGGTAGVTGQGVTLESFRVWLENAPPGLMICYTPHFANTGWSADAVCSTSISQGPWQGSASTTLEAVSIRLLDES